MKDYKITTKTNSMESIFITSAKTPRLALKRLVNYSFDFKMTDEDKFLTIKIKELK
jgi:hypothetical protein